VISQKPKPGIVLPGGGKVNLVVSRGRKRQPRKPMPGDLDAAGR
jgi:hypothetical protein